MSAGCVQYGHKRHKMSYPSPVLVICAGQPSSSSEQVPSLHTPSGGVMPATPAWARGRVVRYAARAARACLFNMMARIRYEK